eukprot:6624024-Pyramimonas_sp.AAC.1
MSGINDISTSYHFKSSLSSECMPAARYVKCMNYEKLQYTRAPCYLFQVINFHCVGTKISISCVSCFLLAY